MEKVEKGELDPYTFGDSKAAINLAKILSEPEHRKYSSKVSVFYGRFNQRMMAIYAVRDFSIRQHLSWLIMKDARDKIGSSVMPELVKSHLLNIMNRVYKMNKRWFVETIKNKKAEEAEESRKINRGKK